MIAPKRPHFRAFENEDGKPRTHRRMSRIQVESATFWIGRQFDERWFDAWCYFKSVGRWPARGFQHITKLSTTFADLLLNRVDAFINDSDPYHDEGNATNHRLSACGTQCNTETGRARRIEKERAAYHATKPLYDAVEREMDEEAKEYGSPVARFPGYHHLRFDVWRTVADMLGLDRRTVKTAILHHAFPDFGDSGYAEKATADFLVKSGFYPWASTAATKHNFTIKITPAMTDDIEISCSCGGSTGHFTRDRAEEMIGSIQSHLFDKRTPLLSQNVVDRILKGCGPQNKPGECNCPPIGWSCPRGRNHDGPCAATRIPDAQTLWQWIKAEWNAAKNTNGWFQQ